MLFCKKIRFSRTKLQEKASKIIPSTGRNSQFFSFKIKSLKTFSALELKKMKKKVEKLCSFFVVLDCRFSDIVLYESWRLTAECTFVGIYCKILSFVSNQIHEKSEKKVIPKNRKWQLFRFKFTVFSSFQVPFLTLSSSRMPICVTEMCSPGHLLLGASICRTLTAIDNQKTPLKLTRIFPHKRYTHA